MSRSKAQIKRDVVDYLPRYYEQFREVQALLDANGEELAGLQLEIRDLLDQFFVDRATWGLANWERVFGIEDGDTRTTAERRSTIKSRMRGSGVTTATLIRNTAEAYDGGEVAVETDAPNYTVTVTFIGTRGVPSNLEDTEQALRDIIPAHLAVEFEFTYLTYDELRNSGGTYDDVLALDLTYDEFKTHKF